jgi:hypothetical protein
MTIKCFAGAAGAALLALGLAAGGARAQVISDIAYTLDAGDAVLSNHYHDGCSLHGPPSSPGPYELRQMTVTTAGVYSVTDLYATGDASLGILVGALDPANPLTNCYDSVDDGRNVSLNAGIYTLVLTTLNDGYQGYAYRFDGPGAVAFAPYTPPATVPTLSEWALILFGGLLLAGGGWMVQRRRAA